MKRITLAAGTLLLLFVLVDVTWAQLKPPIIADVETGHQKVMYSESGKHLYDLRWTQTKTVEDGRTLVKFSSRGNNTLKGEERVEWTEESLAELTSKGFRTLSWKKDSSGAEKESWKITYNWQKHEAEYVYQDHLKDKKERKVLKFSANTFPSDAMFVLLRGFPFEKGEGYKIEGDFLLTDGSTLSGAIIHRGEEKLKTAFGVLDAYKLEMKPSGLTGVFAPTMYLWYSRKPPHVFLRFDGRDEGVFKPRTTNVMVSFSPEPWVHP